MTTAMDPTSFTNLTSTTTINSYLLSLSTDPTTNLRLCPEWTAYADAKNKTGYLNAVAPESLSDYEGRITLSKCQKSLVSAGGLALISSDLESVTGSAMEWRTVAVMRQGATLYVFDAVWDNETTPGMRIAAVVGIANVRKLKDRMVRGKTRIEEVMMTGVAGEPEQGLALACGWIRDMKMGAKKISDFEWYSLKA